MELYDAMDSNFGSLTSESLVSPWSGVSVRFEVIGREQALKYLETYKEDYRKLRKSHVKTLSSDMMTDNWRFDGDTIKFMDEDGAIVLGDGQHRLKPGAETGIAQEFLVVSDIPVVTYDTMGAALPRNFADALRRSHFNNTI